VTTWTIFDLSPTGTPLGYDRPFLLPDGRRGYLIVTRRSDPDGPDGWVWTVSGLSRSFAAEYDSHRETLEECQAVAEAWLAGVERIVAGG
jgi:hypothetical protein